MKKSEIKIGGHYTALVSNKLTTVRVDNIFNRTLPGYRPNNTAIRYDVTNIATGRKTTFRSAAKFRSYVGDGKVPVSARPVSQKEIDKVNVAACGSTINPLNSPHLIVEARAGTGKTTTLVEGVRFIMGTKSAMIPSPQQAAVWEEMSKSQTKSVCFVAFNRSIADELRNRVPQGCEAMTMHSLGLKAVTKALGRMEANSYVVQDIIAEILECDSRELKRDDPLLLGATEKLVSLCKMNLVNFDVFGKGGSGTDAQYTIESALDELVSYYEIELNGNKQKVYDLVPKVLERCKKPIRRINFDDMIWLPVVLKLPVQRYDVLLVDEAQDLNRCQQALAKMAGSRLILCGDPKQAIYGFAGADTESMPRMYDELRRVQSDNGATRGCVRLPLTVTRRCGKAIVAEACKIVPDFSAFETNPDGKVSRAQYESVNGESPTGTLYTNMAEDGNMVLCRVNAPLVSQCFRFLKAGRKATIQGRDIGTGLISTIKKLMKDNQSVVDLAGKLSDWLNIETSKELAKRQPNEGKLIALQDRYDCLVCFAEHAETVSAVIAKIESVFTDNKDNPGIRLSSIHKAKGLEAKRVFLLEPNGATVPHPMAKSAWQREQEMNLRYVAITRAIEELVYVS